MCCRIPILLVTTILVGIWIWNCLMVKRLRSRHVIFPDFRKMPTLEHHYALIGMATTVDNIRFILTLLMKKA